MDWGGVEGGGGVWVHAVVLKSSAMGLYRRAPPESVVGEKKSKLMASDSPATAYPHYMTATQYRHSLGPQSEKKTHASIRATFPSPEIAKTPWPVGSWRSSPRNPT